VQRQTVINGLIDLLFLAAIICDRLMDSSTFW